MCLSQGSVVLGGLSEKGGLALGQVAQELGGVAGPNLASRDSGIGGNKSASGNHSTRLNLNAIHESSAHPNKCVTHDCAAVEGGAMTDSNPVADNDGQLDTLHVVLGYVDDRVVLNVCHGADGNAVDIAAQRGAIPHGRSRTNLHVANNTGAGGNESGLANGWHAALKVHHGAVPVQHLLERVRSRHAASQAVERLAGFPQRDAEPSHKLACHG
mmetsp:Transcript_17498/g.38129  ORF Transcript_17498/g.38129 Transcript_17498/m.38129 type:complete len:214 (+) Transcript_17498:432-1073(+)